MQHALASRQAQRISRRQQKICLRQSSISLTRRVTLASVRKLCALLCRERRTCRWSATAIHCSRWSRRAHFSRRMKESVGSFFVFLFFLFTRFGWGRVSSFWKEFCPRVCFRTRIGSKADLHPREAAPALHRPPTSAAGARVPDYPVERFEILHKVANQ